MKRISNNPKFWKVVIDENGQARYFNEEELSDISSLDQINLNLGNGVYTTFRTFYHTKALGLDEHFERLRTSAHLLGFNIELNSFAIRSVLRDILKSGLVPEDELRVRITVVPKAVVDIYISVEPLSIPTQSDYHNGVIVVTRSLQRQNPKAKSTQFIASASAIRRIISPDINEVVMLDANGNFLEGFTSNFFAINDNEIWTAEEGVLPGTTRGIILELLKKENLQIRMGALRKTTKLDEAFITSVSRGVLPIREIDNVKLIAPGPITYKAMQLYANYLETAIEEI